MERRGIDGADELSAALTDAGLGLEELGVLDTVEEEDRPAVAVWVAWTAACAGLAAQVGEATGRLGELVAAMRTYSRLDEAAEQDVDLRRGLEDTLRILAPRLRAGITVQREYADGLPAVIGSPGALNQVWTHLIENAADAMEGRGVLRVATARQGDRAVVSITDDGPGIPADVRERIFEPFFTTKPVGQGVGLGLDIVSRIVQGSHHGEVRVRSRPGLTRFDVLLPLGPDGRDPGADPGGG
jgi:signal transduction histidine kinase